MKKWTKIITLMLTLVAVLAFSSVTAFAYTDESVIDENFESVETTPEETTEPAPEATENTETADKPFSVEGNGEVLDNMTDGKTGKEFYTVTTANNNTFYIIIDHASNTKNVYMLSMIDENDLSEFIVAEEPETPVVDVQPSVDLGDEPDGGEENPGDGKEEPKNNNMVGTILIIAVLGVIAGGGYYYFKIYKPKKEAAISDDEDMEGYIDEGETVNEDEENGGKSNNADSDSSEDEPDFEDEDE